MPRRAPSPRAAVGRRERKKRETRRRILNAASTLFAERGFDATTVDDLADAADVSRATFFNYFEEKSGVVTALADAMMETFVEDAASVRQLALDTESRLATLFTSSAKRLAERPDLSRALLFEAVARRRDLVDRKTRTGRLHDALGDILADGVAQGDVRDGVALALLYEIVAGGYAEVVLTWMVDEGYRLDERLTVAAHVLSAAIAPPAS